MLILCGIYFFVPLSPWPASRSSGCRRPGSAGRRCSTAGPWAACARAFHDPVFGPWPCSCSLKLAVGAIIVIRGSSCCRPSLWVHLRLPKARPLVEFLTVLPYVVPPIALVVGVAGTFRDARTLVPQLRALPDPVLRRAGHALHLPRPGRRASGPSTCEPWSTRPAAWARAGAPPSGGCSSRTSERPSSARPSSPPPWCWASSPSPRCCSSRRCRPSRQLPQQRASGRRRASACCCIVATTLLLGVFIGRHPRPAGRYRRRRADHRTGRRGHTRSTMATLSFDGVQQGVRTDRRARPARPGAGGGRAGQPPRAERLREDDGAAHRGRVRVARRRPGAASTASTSRARRPTSGTWAWSSRATACSRT